MGIEADPIKKQLTVAMVIKTLENDPLTDLRKAIEEIPGITHYKMN